jgi:hypothetical protein
VRVLAEAGLITAPEAARRFIAAKWKEMHKEKFHCDPDGFRPKVPTKTATMIMHRSITKWCKALWALAGDEKEVEKYFEYVLENWLELKAKVFPTYEGPIPHLAFISHDRVYRTIRGCMVGGIPKGIRVKPVSDNMQDRAAGTDWEKETDGW